MDTLTLLLQGFASALTPEILFFGLLGCFLGTLVGVLPGISPSLTIALLLPLTYKVPATSMFVMFAGIYYGGMYGGSTTSILLNTPGESSTIVTAMEGNLMARRGRAGAALSSAAIGSFIAGTIGTLALTFFSPFILDVALSFGPAEYFCLMVLALAAVTSLLGDSFIRGAISLVLGLLFGMVGIDLQSGQPRFAFGKIELLDGIEMTVAVVGLFAVAEVFYRAFVKEENAAQHQIKDSLWLAKKDWKRSIGPWLRGTFLGFPLGALPAGGAELPTLLSYYSEKKLAARKNKVAAPNTENEFGHGAIEGVAGPEAANNAAAAGVLMPLLTLGIPTSATAAVLMAAFSSYGITPGPTLFASQGPLIWTLIASLYIGNVLLLILNLPLVGLWVRLLKIPEPWLYSGILLVATAAVYGASASIFNVGMLYFFGLLGFVMRLFSVPATPLLLGLILSPLAEQSLRQALVISQGSFLTFIERPISLSLLVVALLMLLLPPCLRWFYKK